MNEEKQDLQPNDVAAGADETGHSFRDGEGRSTLGQQPGGRYTQRPSRPYNRNYNDGYNQGYNNRRAYDSRYHNDNGDGQYSRPRPTGGYNRDNYGNRYNNNEEPSYRERFLASQTSEGHTPLMASNDEEQPQRRRRMRISEVRALEGSGSQPRYNNRSNYDHPSRDHNHGGGYRSGYSNESGDRYPQRDGNRYYNRNNGGGRYNNNYGSEYERRPYERSFDPETQQQRDFYKERYNQARETHRQQYDDRPQYGDRAPYGEQQRRPYTQQRRPYNPEGNSGYNNRGGSPYSQHTAPYKKPMGMSNKPPHKPKMPEPVVYEDVMIGDDVPIRLNKFLANSGVCSRREADELIQAGGVLVNGEPCMELGTKITLKDIVTVNGKDVRPENKIYILLNKPRNCVTTSEDPQERMTVLHLVRHACKERIYPVGRLDRNTTGVLLLTNDGDLASKLVHPSFKKKKIYHVWLDKPVTVEDMQRIADGVELEDGEMHADAISYASEEDQTQVGIEIHSGRNRIVRRLFEHLGYHVNKLDRVYFAGLTKKNLGRGKWRYLTQEEVNMLRMGAFE